MSDLNFGNTIVLVPTIIIGITVLGAVAYGIKKQLSGSDSESVYSTSDEPSISSSIEDSVKSTISDGVNFVNDSFSSNDSNEVKGGSRKKTKRKSKCKSKAKGKSKKCKSR
jgi:hypothetical protein